MSSENNQTDAHDQTASGWDTFGGPDQGGREDILSSTGQEPHLGMDVIGGPDGPRPEDVLSELGQPASPATHDILGGPDSPGREDILSPPGED